MARGSGCRVCGGGLDRVTTRVTVRGCVRVIVRGCVVCLGTLVVTEPPAERGLVAGQSPVSVSGVEPIGVSGGCCCMPHELLDCVLVLGLAAAPARLQH